MKTLVSKVNFSTTYPIHLGVECLEQSEDSALLQKRGDVLDVAYLEKLKFSRKEAPEVARRYLFTDSEATLAARLPTGQRVRITT